MDILGKLFGNNERIKLMRFLVLNDRKAYSAEDLSKRTGISGRPLTRELDYLTKIAFVKRRSERAPQTAKGGRLKKIALYMSNAAFPHRKAVKDLFVAVHPVSASLITKVLGKTGRVKLIIASGIFVGEPDGRLDLLIVGDRLDKKALDRAVHSLERMLGRELRYALLETSDFSYRVSVLDRLVRDVLDYPHQKLLNRIGL